MLSLLLLMEVKYKDDNTMKFIHWIINFHKVEAKFKNNIANMMKDWLFLNSEENILQLITLGTIDLMIWVACLLQSYCIRVCLKFRFNILQTKSGKRNCIT